MALHMLSTKTGPFPFSHAPLRADEQGKRKLSFNISWLQKIEYEWETLREGVRERQSGPVSGCVRVCPVGCVDECEAYYEMIVRTGGATAS